MLNFYDAFHVYRTEFLESISLLAFHFFPFILIAIIYVRSKSLLSNNNNDESDNSETSHNKRENSTPQLSTILWDRLLEAQLVGALTPLLTGNLLIIRHLLTVFREICLDTGYP